MKATPVAVTQEPGTRRAGAAERPAWEREAKTGTRRAIDQRLVTLTAPASFEADQYRALRSRLESSREGRDLRIVAVTSAVVGDGKTTTSINLAGALAQGRDSRVLLVDADLRRPSVARHLGIDEARTPGLTDAVLDETPSLSGLVKRLPPSQLEVLTAGRPSPDPYEVLRAPHLRTLLDEARGRYQFIVVDTPPIVPVPDCGLIARWADGLLIVVAAHRTPRKLLEESLNQLPPDKVVGMVFNGDDHATAGYHDYYRAYPSSRGGPLDR
jgi:capsular exopolysaccharide synthesis family protein